MQKFVYIEVQNKKANDVFAQIDILRAHLHPTYAHT